MMKGFSLVSDSPESKKTCGIVMPISAIDGCPESHWKEVRNILDDAINDANMTPRLVSDADDVGVIQKRIIQNLYDDDIIVCDVSGKNSNVMFELGMRLAFDKPTIIVKDDATSYSFDTSPVEHVPYRRDLRFSDVTSFKKILTAKINSTMTSAETDPNYTAFLGNFGTFTTAKIDEKDGPYTEVIMDEFRSMNLQMSRIVADIREIKRIPSLHMGNRVKKIDPSPIIRSVLKHYDVLNIHDYFSSREIISQDISQLDKTFAKQFQTREALMQEIDIIAEDIISSF